MSFCEVVLVFGAFLDLLQEQIKLHKSERRGGGALSNRKSKVETEHFR